MTVYVYNRELDKMVEKGSGDDVSTTYFTIPDNAHVSHALPRKGSGIEKLWNKFDGGGKPFFEGNKDVREFTARTEGMFGYDR